MSTFSNPPVGTTLHWTSNCGRSYRLDLAGSLVAQLVWQSPFGSTARGETAHGAWTIKRMGFLKPVVTVRRAGEEREVAVLKHRGKGDYELTVGGQYTFLWRKIKQQKHATGFYDIGEHLVLFVKTKERLTDIDGEVAVKRTGLHPEVMSILLLVSWYFLALAYSDDSATTTAVLIAAIS